MFLRRSVTLSLAACMTFCVPAASEQANSGTTAAIVLDHIGHIKNAKLIRHGAEIGLATFAEIRAGDDIAITDPATKIILRFTDGTRAEIGKSDSPFRVQLRGKPVALSDKLSDKVLGALKKIGQKIDNDRLYGTGAPTGTRGPHDTVASAPIRFRTPGLFEEQCLIASGERRLGLAWEGGLAPYQVQITLRDQQQLLDVKVDAPQVITTEPRRLVEGRYDVVIQDSQGAKTAGGCTVVDTSAYPSSELVVPEWLGPDVAKVVTACERANRDAKRWSYDGYLALVGAGSSEFLLVARRVIADGACDTVN